MEQTEPTFRPCIDRSACTEGGSHCRACGRSHAEIEALRRQVVELADFIEAMGYGNPDDFLDWLQKKVRKRLQARRAAAA